MSGGRSNFISLAALALLLLLVFQMNVQIAKAARVRLSGDDDDGEGSGGDDDNKEQGAKKGLLGVMQSSMSAISKLRTLVSKYQHDRHIGSDTKSVAVLSDCADLASDSRDAVHDSLSILVKLLESRKSNTSTDHRDGDGSVDDLRTNLSAALTDITTCTDELHDEVPDEVQQQVKKAVMHIDKQAMRASQLLSKALNLTASV